MTNDALIRDLERKVASGDESAIQGLLRARARSGEIQIIESQNGNVYRSLGPYGGRKSDVYGNNRACNCPDLVQIDRFCVCIARVWCEKHGGPRCVGGHD